MAGRIAYLDTLRAASILYIVGFWHLTEYTKALPGCHNNITQRVTVIVLGLFIFLSGYLLALGRDALLKHGTAHFYIRRLIRIYPLYLLTLLLWAAIHIENPVTLAKAALLITPIWGPQPFTLWFITCLLLYYITAPLLIRANDKPMRFALIALGLFLLLSLACSATHKGDIRLAQYFPAFATGIFAAGRPEALKKHILPILIGLACAIYATTLIRQSPESSLYSIPMTCLAPLAILPIAEWLSGKALATLLAPVAYASYVMYLLHRPIYAYLSHRMPPTADERQLLQIFFLFLPTLIALSWIAQKLYDLLLGLIRIPNKRGPTPEAPATCTK